MTVDAPFSPRLIGITPIILLFPALAIDRVLRIRWISARWWRTAAVTSIVAVVVVLSAWWSLRTTFVRYPASSRIGNRDFIVRLAADLGDVNVIANFVGTEDFKHQAYRALVPRVRGKNLESSKPRVKDYMSIVEAFGPRTLVITPLGDTRFYGLCNRMGGTRSGTITSPHAIVGFEWCFIE